MVRSRSERLPAHVRAGVVLGVSSLLACLGVPTGKARAWPVSDGSVLAVAAGDVDGDGISDLVMLVGGTEAGLYVLRGGVDLPPTGAANSFSTVVPLSDAAAPAALAVLGPPGQPANVVVTRLTADGPRIDVFHGATLTPVSTTRLDATAGTSGSAAWIRQTPFGPGGQFVLFDVGTQVFHIDPSSLFSSSAPTFDTVPPPDGNGWPNSAFVDGATSGNEVWVAGADSAWSGIAGEGPIHWQRFRSGATWRAQVPLNLTGAIDAVVGVDGSSTAQLCAIEPDTGHAHTCLSTGVRPPPGAMRLLTDEVTGDSTPDLIGAAEGASPLLVVFPNVRLDTATDSVVADAPLFAPGDVPGAFLATGQFTAAEGRQILAIGEDGAMGCYQVQAGALTGCSPP